ncbi:MAG: tetratricopeptide repeat protein [Planctomycetota bacterium]|nr:tetratricopeptide repeat protein [Planctomycetota bacterium]
MATRAALSCVLFVGLAFGCAGPSQRGLVARQAAHDRIGRVNSGIALEQGERSLRAGEFTDALRAANGILKSYPTDANALMLRGRTLQEMYKTEEAAADFRAALATDPSRADAWYYIGVIDERFGRAEEAREAFDAAACLQPTNLQFAMAGVEALIAIGDIDGALSRIDEVSTKFEFSHQLMHLHTEVLQMAGRSQEAFDWLVRADAIAPPGTYHRELILAAFEARSYGKCLAQLDEPESDELRKEPEFVRLRARTLAMEGRAVEARDLMSEATEWSDKPTAADWLVLGQVAWLAGDWGRVGLAGQRLEALREYPVDAAIFLGGSAQFTGDFTAARVQFARALEQDPSRVAAEHMLEKLQR